MILIRKVRSILLLTLGFISFGFGVIGTILPGLPGGPFFLFAGFCFTRGSKRIDNCFKRTSFYKQYVVRYFRKKEMTRKEKIRINIISDFFILLSIWYFQNWIVTIIMLGLLLYKHYFFIKKIKTVKLILE